MGVERSLVVAMTGASGSIYGIRFLEAVLEHYDRIYLTISENAGTVIKTELGIDVPTDATDTRALLGRYCEKVEICCPYDLTAPPASGSVPHEGMVVIPCSMGTIGRIAAGVSNDLTTRAADVCLKEGRKLIAVIRETPLSLIHLRNLTRLSEAGATILPASPAFYSTPRTIEDLVEFVVARTMAQLGLKHPRAPEWRRAEE